MYSLHYFNCSKRYFLDSNYILGMYYNHNSNMSPTFVSANLILIALKYQKGNPCNEEFICDGFGSLVMDTIVLLNKLKSLMQLIHI